MCLSLWEQNLDADDIRLAIASRLNHHYAQMPSREVGTLPFDPHLTCVVVVDHKRLR